MLTVSESDLGFKIQALSNKFKMAQVSTKVGNEIHTKMYADDNHIATKIVPKVAKPSYLMDIDLVGNLIKKAYQ